MRKPAHLVLIFMCIAVAACLTLSFQQHTTAQTKTAQTTGVPKIWDAKQLATWATPVAGINKTTNFYSEEEYYAAPIDNVRTYSVYAPDKEPKGYREWILNQGRQRLIEPEKLQTERDWIEAGRTVFAGLDFPVTRTDDPRVMKYLS